VVFFFFFFQAEDGIRDWSVTGVQTCALPICTVVWSSTGSVLVMPSVIRPLFDDFMAPTRSVTAVLAASYARVAWVCTSVRACLRSEERRVGKEGRARWSPSE